MRRWGRRQLARRPLRYTRSALLLMLAISMGVFALSYAATWSSSQRDQAAYQAGAAVRVVPGTSLERTAGLGAAGGYAGLESLALASPVERARDGVLVPAAAGSADLLAIDADSALPSCSSESDESASPARRSHGCAAGRPPGPRLATLPDGTTSLRITPVIDISRIVREVYDEETGEVDLIPLDLADLEAIRVRAAAIVRDARGLLYRGWSEIRDDGRCGAGAARVTRARKGSGGPASCTLTGAHLDGPVELAGLALEVWLPQETLTTEGIDRGRRAVRRPRADGPWTQVVPVSARRLAGDHGRRAADRSRDVPAEPDRGHDGPSRRRRVR